MFLNKTIFEPRFVYEKRFGVYENTAKICCFDSVSIFKTLTNLGLIGNSNHSLLDLGCGTCLASSFFAETGIQIVGADISFKMLLEGKKRSVNNLCCSDIREGLPFSSSSFDFVISNGVICLLEEIPSIFKEVGRVIKREGIFAFTVEDLTKIKREQIIRSRMRIFCHSFDFLKENLLKNNFSIIDESNFPSYSVPSNAPCGGRIIFSSLIVCQKN